jgi:hypothetical protein
MENRLVTPLPLTWLLSVFWSRVFALRRSVISLDGPSLPKPTLVTPHKHKVYDKMDLFASPSPSKKARIMSLKL